MPILLLLLLLPMSGYAAIATAPEAASGYINKPLVSAKKSMVVTNNPYATVTATNILAAGGNAFDAAIAASFVLGLVEPQSSGIGGGGYALTYLAKDKSMLSFDGREVAPKSVKPNLFLDEKGKPIAFKAAVLSAESIGVPGEVALLYKIHQKYGTLPWQQLIAPAIQLAQHGFNMSPRLFKLLSTDKTILEKNPAVKNIFFEKNHIKPVGTLIINQPYAKTLITISKDPLSFYHGTLARDIINAINQDAGKNIYTNTDFANYQVKLYPALCANYRNRYQICSVPPSSAGGITLLQLMTIYADAYQANNANDMAWHHYFLEASKLAYADRNMYCADPDFTKQADDLLLAPDYLKERSKLIHAKTSLPLSVPAGTPEGSETSLAPDNHRVLLGTTSLVIVDKNNNAISMTLTIESQFGSHVFTHGFFLNNELTDFSFLSENHEHKPIANRIEPGKRPRSSITPTMVFNNDQLYALSGSPGGDEIICYVAKSLILMLDMHLSADKASAATNLCANNSGVFIESTTIPMVSGITNIIKNASGGWDGAADPRREGVASGK